MTREDTIQRIEKFSMLDERTQDNPFDFYHLLQDERPVYRMPETGFYMITRYDDVRAVLRNSQDFLNWVPPSQGLAGDRHALYQSVLREHGWENKPTLQRCDGDEHKRYRKLVERVFSIDRVRALLPRLEELTNLIIDRFIDRGECEFVSEFALMLPGMFISEQLGLNPDEVQKLKKWGDALTAMRSRLLTEDEVISTAKVELECQHHLAEIFEARRKEPREDILSNLVHSHQDGEEPLSMSELQGLGAQLLAAGFETTMNGITHGMIYLLRNRDQMDRLIADRSLMPGFVEETLRIDSPNAGILRRAGRDTEINGTPIPEGAILMVRMAAANRDARKFEDPDKFDLCRKNAGVHVAFGFGPHRCVGSLLAKAEMEIAFNAIFDRMENIDLAEPLPEILHAPDFWLRPVKHVKLKFNKIA